MILDSFTLETVVFQIRYSEAYRVWDHAGEIAQRLCLIWPDLKLYEGRPNQQIFKGKNVTIQTGLTDSAVTISGADSLGKSKVKQLTKTFEEWCQVLKFTDLTQISTLATYEKIFPSLMKANAEMIGLNLVRWPTDKVFDQPIESENNGVEVFYRFQDEESFSTLRLNVEQTKYEVDLNPSYVDVTEIRKTKCRMLIKFDRGILGSINPQKFRVDDWIKGYQHVLHRDIEKVTKGQV